MRNTFLAIFILSACIQSHADPIQRSIEELMQNWDAEVALEFSKEKIRAASISLEYDRTISHLESTQQLIGAVNGDPKKTKITYSILQDFQWSNPHIRVYFLFVLCELVGVNAHALMHHTDTDESTLEELLGVLFFDASLVRKSQGEN